MTLIEETQKVPARNVFRDSAALLKGLEVQLTRLAVENKHTTGSPVFREFALWAATQGYRRVPTSRHECEVLRLRQIQGHGKPVIFYTKNQTFAGGNPIHASSQADGLRLVRRWLAERAE